MTDRPAAKPAPLVFATPAEQAAAALDLLSAAFASAIQDAQEDQRRSKFLRHWVDPKAREQEFAGYAQKTAAAKQQLGAGDKAGAGANLQELRTAFDAAAAGYRKLPQDMLESFFGLYTQEAQKYEGYSATADALLKFASG